MDEPIENISPSEFTEITYFEEQLQQAEDGNINAINYVAAAYYDGSDVGKSFKKSFEWSMKAATQGNSVSQYNVGWLYEKGEGVEQDYDEALKWYTMAADKKYPKALCALGYMNYLGYGTEINYKLAYSLFLKAAAGFDSDAMLCIAQMYEDGVGVEQDTNAANLWYEIASNNHSDKVDSYRYLQEVFDNKTYDIKMQSLENVDSAIPNELILEAQRALFSYDYFELYEKYKANSEINIENLNLSENLKETLQYMRWYDNYFIADINGDGKSELLIYRLEGTMGISSFSVISLNEENQYDFDIFTESEYINSQEVWFGVPQLLEFEDKYFFALIYSDYIDRTISSIEIFAFSNNKLTESVKVSTKLGELNYIKTSQSNREMDKLVNLVEADIENIMYKTIEEQECFMGDENKLSDTEKSDLLWKVVSEAKGINFCADIDNDGALEYF